ncbi:F-box/kelch-repeat protein At3g23880-like [Coffea arabica]|uniref:F-box/kelch-repeat protein At3g23880-like n=1 Tax=Coffea arabica TaxID=13443 RepID=A0A6P6WVR3_COFAR|nr:F-box/kelch-repeat protein At3g23880-like [Coffea arabica]
MPIATVPDELVYEILLRLPVISLLRFKLVSKSWLSLISSCEFVKAHLKFNEKNQQVLFQGYDAYAQAPGFYLKHYSLNSLLDGEVDPADPVSLCDIFHEATGYKVPYCRACCNGLIFTALNYKDFPLWNPSTRKFKKLPYSGLPEVSAPGWTYFMAYGFGYDEYSDDYKAAVVVSYKDAHCDRTSPQSTSYDRSPIISLDLATDKCAEVEEPNYHSPYYTNLGICEGNLSLICHSRGSLPSEIWVMKENSAGVSWIKLLGNLCNDLSIALHISCRGEFLGVFDSRLGLWN